MKEIYDYALLKEPMILGISVIDNQHANLKRMINNLYFACLNNSKTANHRFNQAVRKTIEYMRQHFSTEEKLMLISDFHGYLNHKNEHGDFLREVLNYSRQMQDGQVFSPQKFIRFLSEWINSHIEDSDNAFADFFLNMQKHDKLRMVLAG